MSIQELRTITLDASTKAADLTEFVCTETPTEESMGRLLMPVLELAQTLFMLGPILARETPADMQAEAGRAVEQHGERIEACHLRIFSAASIEQAQAEMRAAGVVIGEMFEWILGLCDEIENRPAPAPAKSLFEMLQDSAGSSPKLFKDDHRRSAATPCWECGYAYGDQTHICK